jgi:hypothetical protein
MNHESIYIKISFLCLILNTVIALGINRQIKTLVKLLYPTIWETISGESILDSSINKSLGFMQLIIKPPPLEITYEPLLRLLKIAKAQFILQFVIIISVVIFAVIQGKH